MEHPRRAMSLRWSTAVAVLAAFAIVMWGGYGRHWSWTGISAKSATLWDWLNLLMLPIAVAILPLWLSRRTRLATRHKAVGLSVLVAFAVLVVAGYAIPWGWTGFLGNKLWDWLELLVLPLTVALIPVGIDLRDSWSARHSLVGLTLRLPSPWWYSEGTSVIGGGQGSAATRSGTGCICGCCRC